jgi:16S rRNA pseudouridine516 synthase
MQSKRSRLDRFIATHTGVAQSEVRVLLAQSRIWVDGAPATAINQLVDEFTHVRFDEKILQAKTPVYVMLHKPVGVVSATRDDKHRTVIDLLDRNDREQLHIVGRLDYNTSGLLLLTNDGRWSRALTEPTQKIAKLYRVTLENLLTDDYITAFAEGMYFSYENITTRPAVLKIISEFVAEVSLVEGRYHQIKRMFGRMNNRVRALHRSSIGNLLLDPSLLPGQSRELTPEEVRTIACPANPSAAQTDCVLQVQ